MGFLGTFRRSNGRNGSPQDEREPTPEEKVKLFETYRDQVLEGVDHPDARDLEMFFLRDPNLSTEAQHGIERHLGDCARCQRLKARYERDERWFRNQASPCD